MAKQTVFVDDKICEHCGSPFNRTKHSLTKRVIESLDHFLMRRFCGMKCSAASLRAAMDERTKERNDNRNAERNKHKWVGDIDDPQDYRNTPEAKRLLTRIEKVVVKKKKATTRFINDRFKAPRGWNLWDLIAVSKEIEITDTAWPLVIAKTAVKGIPAADPFKPATADKRIEANLGL